MDGTAETCREATLNNSKADILNVSHCFVKMSIIMKKYMQSISSNSGSRTPGRSWSCGQGYAKARRMRFFTSDLEIWRFDGSLFNGLTSVLGSSIQYFAFFRNQTQKFTWHSRNWASDNEGVKSEGLDHATSSDFDLRFAKYKRSSQCALETSFPQFPFSSRFISSTDLWRSSSWTLLMEVVWGIQVSRQGMDFLSEANNEVRFLQLFLVKKWWMLWGIPFLFFVFVG